MKNNLLIIASTAVIVIISFIFYKPGEVVTETTKDKVSTACEPDYLSGVIKPEDRLAVFEGQEVNVSDLALMPTRNNEKVLGVASEERWVEVDLSEQKLMAWEGDELFLETPISSGLPSTPTPTGEFRVWIKLRATKMSGGSGAGYYYLPNVPYVMYFGNEKVPNFRGFGLHGTYWHNDFGTQRSHGCVNIPTPVAKEIYEWSSPVLPEGQNMIRSTTDNPGMRVVIHE